MVYFYTFFMTILMVNLLIAQMGARFEAMTEEGFETWLQERISLVREYKDLRDPLPPPLNVVYILLVDMPRLLRRIARLVLPTLCSAPPTSDTFGFQIKVKGRTLRRANEITCELRERYLSNVETEEGDEGAAVASAIEEANASTAKLSNRVDSMQLQLQRLESKLDKLLSRG